MRFELTIPVKVYSLSRRALSATQPSLQPTFYRRLCVASRLAEVLTKAEAISPNLFVYFNKFFFVETLQSLFAVALLR